jgi:site-specific recombinase XerD
LKHAAAQIEADLIICSILARLAAGAGIEAEHISGHSCRVGMAQDLVAAGAELPLVMNV